jgi:protein TonB
MVTTNAVRFPLANLLALLLMAGLFTALFNVIVAHRVVVEPKPVTTINFTPLIHREESPAARPPLDPPRRDPLPPTPTLVSDGPGLGSFPVLKGPVDTEPLPVTNGRIDTAEAPLIRINPDYPRRAIAARMEGWVQLQFTVAPSGAVSDVVVIDADPKGVFDDAAMKAVSRWKYAPKILDGRAVERRGLKVVLRFSLD